MCETTTVGVRWSKPSPPAPHQAIEVSSSSSSPPLPGPAPAQPAPRPATPTPQKAPGRGTARRGRSLAALAAALRKIEASRNVIATLAQLTTPSKHSRLPDDPVAGLANSWEDLPLAGLSKIPLRLGPWPFLHARLPASGLAIFTAIVVAGCGGGSSTPTSPASSSPPAGQLTSGVSKCLKKHGVRLPSGQPGAGSGQPPSGGSPPSGGFPPSGGSPPSGGNPGGNLGGLAKALKACGVNLPQGAGPGG